MVPCKSISGEQESRSSQKPLFHWPCQQLLLFLGLKVIVVVVFFYFSLPMVRDLTRDAISPPPPPPPGFHLNGHTIGFC